MILLNGDGQEMTPRASHLYVTMLQTPETEKQKVFRLLMVRMLSEFVKNDANLAVLIKNTLPVPSDLFLVEQAFKEGLAPEVLAILFPDCDQKELCFNVRSILVGVSHALTHPCIQGDGINPTH